MGFNEALAGLDFNKFKDYMIDIFFKVVYYPFGFWNALPSWVRYGIFGFILLLAIFIAVITWKYRDTWKYFN